MLKVDINEISLTGKQPLLSGVNFILKPNRIYSILGLNGAGKTTLIKSLTGLLNPYLYSITGSSIWNDEDILCCSVERRLAIRRHEIKYVFQDAVNSFDHLKKFGYYFGRLNAGREELDGLLEYFILPPYNELKKLYPFEVSGGMAQRISLTLALLAHPELIILDEPTSGIDSAIANLILLKLKEFAGYNNNSVLLVTHDMDFAEKISDETAYLSNGSLSRFCPVKELLHDDKNPNPELLRLISAYKQLAL